MQVAEQVVLVTGASSGIGRATAIAFARSGARVLVHGRDQARTAEAAQRTGGAPLLGDLGRPGAAEDLATRARRVHGRVDVVVANAGHGLSAPFTEVDPRAIDELVAVDLVAPIQLVRALLPAMVERDHGHVVLVGSVAGRAGVAGEAVYAAAKAGLDAFAESLRLELVGTRVGVTLAVPGVVDTAFDPGRGGARARRVPRPVPATTVAGAILRGVLDDRAEVWVPGWLRLAPAVRGVAPGPYRRLSERYGEPVRIRPRGGSGG